MTKAVYIFYFDHVHMCPRCIYKAIEHLNLYKVAIHFQGPRNRLWYGNADLAYNNIGISLLSLFSKQIENILNWFDALRTQDCDLIKPQGITSLVHSQKSQDMFLVSMCIFNIIFPQ